MKTLVPRIAVLSALLLAARMTAARAEEKKDDKPEKPVAAVGTVSGTVTVAGQPLPGGWITFHGPDGVGSVRANIDVAGKYTLPGVRSDRAYRLTIEVEGVRALAENTREELARLERRAELLKQAKVENAVTDRRIKELKERVKVLQQMAEGLKKVKVSPKYESRETTPLTCEVKKGAQVFDVQLQD